MGINPGRFAAMRLWPLASALFLLFAACQKSAATGSEYVGYWEGTIQADVGGDVPCHLEISQLTKAFVIKSLRQTASNCTAYEGVYVLTPEGHLKKDAATEPVLIALDKQNHRAIVSGLGHLRYLSKIEPAAGSSSPVVGKIGTLFERRNPLVGRWECVKVISRFGDGTEKTEEKLPYHLVRSFAENGTYEIIRETDGRTTFRVKGTFAISDENHFSQTITDHERPEFIGYTDALEYKRAGQELIITNVPNYGKQTPRNPVVHQIAYFKPAK